MECNLWPISQGNNLERKKTDFLSFTKQISEQPNKNLNLSAPELGSSFINYGQVFQISEQPLNIILPGYMGKCF